MPENRMNIGGIEYDITPLIGRRIIVRAGTTALSKMYAGRGATITGIHPKAGRSLMPFQQYVLAPLVLCHIDRADNSTEHGLWRTDFEFEDGSMWEPVRIMQYDDG